MEKIRYSLVIADDELMMRNGLSHIDWESFGYKLDAVMSDGSEVIEYLRKNSADVLLMDIKMVHVSGIDVAKYVAENNVDTKIILLSGYKDFEFARKALGYRVESYLLKPISIPLIREEFKKLYDKLESRNTERHEYRSRIKHFDKLIHFYRKQFFFEADLGLFSKTGILSRSYELLKLSEKDFERHLVKFEMTILNDDVSRKMFEGYGSSEMIELIERMLSTFNPNLEFFLLQSKSYKLVGLFWEYGDSNIPDLEKLARQHLRNQIEDIIGTITGFTIQIENIEYYTNLSEFMKKPVKDRHSSSNNDESHNKIHEMKKLIMSYIQESQKEEALSLFDVLVNTCMDIGLSFCKEHVSHLFSVAIDKCSRQDPAFASTLLKNVSVLQLNALNTYASISKWGEYKIEYLCAILEERKGQLHTRNNNIQIVKEFIEKNYEKDITLADIAEQVCLNPIYLSRLFKEWTGETFTEYLVKVRINTAASILKNTSMYVYEVARKSGYSDYKYFSKIFKRLMGCLPTEYRQKKQPMILNK